MNNEYLKPIHGLLDKYLEEDSKARAKQEEERIARFKAAETPEGMLKQIDYLKHLLKIKDQEIARINSTLRDITLDKEIWMDKYYNLKKKKAVTHENARKRIIKILQGLKGKDFEDWGKYL